MQQEHFQNELTSAKKLASIFMLSTIFLSIALSISGFAIYRLIGHVQFTMVPYGGITKSVSVTQVAPSDEYLREIAIDVARDKFSVTPNTVHSTYQRLLAMVDSNYYNSFGESLKDDEKNIKAMKTSSTFYPTGEVGISDLNVYVKGRLVKYTGERWASSKDIDVEIDFSYPNGLLRIKNIVATIEKGGS